ncbi:MAG: NAD(+)/NADH kinase [Lachnospiraceae bacterium]|nr:NAD(+)/NADH kinase [Lachnospiraceae bacterium]
MRKFAIITNAYKDKEMELTHKIISYIQEYGGEAVSMCEQEGTIRDCDEIDFSLMPKDTECMIVLGGDGTLIRTATRARKHGFQIPLIGVNLGTLGYLCELEGESILKNLQKLMKDTYMLEERMMLEGYKKTDIHIDNENANDKSTDMQHNIHIKDTDVQNENRNNEHIKSTNIQDIVNENVKPVNDTVIEKVWALNDIVIHRAGKLSLLTIHVYVDGERLGTYDADGIIISTPTGSTGYNMSAGGPIVDPKAKILLLTPINAHNLNSKGIILRSEDVIEVELVSRRGSEADSAYVSCDGDRLTKLEVGDRFVVERAVHTINICKVNKQSFLETMRKKMK